MTEREAAYYLAAMIDGEGSVTWPPCGPADAPHGRSVGARCVTITNTDPFLIRSTCRALDRLKIKWHKYHVARKPPRKACIRIHITGRQNLERLLETVPLKAPGKRWKLIGCIQSYRNYNWRKVLPGRSGKSYLGNPQQTSLQL